MNKKVFLQLAILIILLAALSTFVNAQDDDALKLAEQGVTSNDEWEPLIREFEGMEMVLVPAGSFMMGSTDEQFEEAVDQCLASQTWPTDRETCEAIAGMTQPASEQHFDAPFWIGRFEVTNEQYGGSANLIDSFGNSCILFSTEPNQPHVCIKWDEAKDFCESLGMRLPTEAEWEYAARGPDNLNYPWGNEFNADNLVYVNSKRPELVGSIPDGASWVGAMDMSGNVFEWGSTIVTTSTNFRPGWDDELLNSDFPYPYDPEDGREDLERIDVRRLLRGGSFDQPQVLWMHTFSRGGNPSFTKAVNFGFRCARDYD